MSLIQFRRNTADGAEASNPVLAVGEPGFERDTGRLKIGDGSTPWNDLPAYQRVVTDEIVVALAADLHLTPGEFTTIPFDTIVSQTGTGLELNAGQVKPTIEGGVYVARLDLTFKHGATRDGLRYAYVDLDGDAGFALGRFSGFVLPTVGAAAAATTEINLAIEGTPGEAFAAYAYCETDADVSLDHNACYLKVRQIA